MANRYFLNIGANWGDTANWSDTSGGTGGFSVPTNADDVFFDANSGNCTVNAATRVCKTLDFTGYTNTITMTNGINVSGNVTLSASMGIAGSGTLTVNATSTFTSNGKTWSSSLTFVGANTFTLADDLSIGGLFSTTTGTVTINGTVNINCSGGITTTNLFQGTGTTTLNLLGGTCTGGVIRLNTNINGNITISGNLFYNTGALTYTSGTVTTTGSTLNIAASTTLNTSGMSWNNVTTSATGITLSSDLNINGLLNVTANTSTNGSFNININSLSVGAGLTFFPNTGNPVLNFMGNGSWIGVGNGTGRLTYNTNIYGNTIISGTVSYDTRTITNYSTNVKTINNATFLVQVFGATLINFDKINFKRVRLASTITMNNFFSGTPNNPSIIESNTSGTNYTIAFQDGFEKITKFTKISNCTVTKRGQLLCITDKSNKGGNVGVRYINQMPNRVPLNSPSTASPLGYAVGQVADPNTILI